MTGGPVPIGGQGTPAPARVAIPYLSFSRLDTYNRCGRQYKLRYVDRAPAQPSGALIGGSVLHACIEAHEQRRTWENEYDEAVEILEADFRHRFDEAVAEAGGDGALRWAGRKTRQFPEGEDAHWWLSQGPVMMRRWYKLRVHDAEHGIQLALEPGTEIEVVAQLEDGTTIKGYIDALVMTTIDGQRMVRDWKTGKVGGGSPMQLATYAWALARGPGIGVDVGEFQYLRRGESRSYDLRPLIPLIDEQYADLARGINAGVFPMKPQSMCVSCDVRESCSYGQTLEPPTLRAV